MKSAMSRQMTQKSLVRSSCRYRKGPKGVFGRVFFDILSKLHPSYIQLHVSKLCYKYTENVYSRKRRFGPAGRILYIFAYICLYLYICCIYICIYVCYIFVIFVVILLLYIYLLYLCYIFAI